MTADDIANDFEDIAEGLLGYVEREFAPKVRTLLTKVREAGLSDEEFDALRHTSGAKFEARVAALDKLFGDLFEDL